MLSEVYLLERTDTTLPPVVVVPYATNGPINPSDGGLDPSATEASTALTFVGEGKHDYGNIVQQNLLYLLENFANGSPPVNPLIGQFWYNTKTNLGEIGMYYWDGTDWKRVSDIDSSTNVIGNINMRGNKIFNLANPIDPQDAVTKSYADGKFAKIAGDTFTGVVITNDDLIANGRVEITDNIVTNSNAIATINGHIDLKSSIEFGDNSSTIFKRRSSIIFEGLSAVAFRPSSNLSMGNNNIKDVGDPILDTDAVNKRYSDLSYAKIAGDTFVGVVNFDDDVFFNKNVHTDVDSIINLNGHVVLDNLILFKDNADVTFSDDSTIKLIDNASITFSDNATLNMGGSIIHGLGDPIDDTDAVNRRYVSAQMTGFAKTTGDTFTGPVIFDDSVELRHVTSLVNNARVELSDNTRLVLESGSQLITDVGSTIDISGKLSTASNAIIDLNMALIHRVGDPVDDYDAANKKYVETMIANSEVDVSGFVNKAGDTMTGTLNLSDGLLVYSGSTVNFGDVVLENVGTPIALSDASNKEYVDNTVNALDVTLRQVILDSVDDVLTTAGGTVTDGQLILTNSTFDVENQSSVNINNSNTNIDDGMLFITNTVIGIDSSNDINLDFGTY